MPWTNSPSQGGIKYWQFVQPTAQKIWSIYHGMNGYPVVEVFAFDDDGVLQKAFPLEIIHLDDNNVEIQWSSPRSGYASFAA